MLEKALNIKILHHAVKVAKRDVKAVRSLVQPLTSHLELHTAHFTFI